MSTASTSPVIQSDLRVRLADRRARLESTIAMVDQPDDLVRLLDEVDHALSRLDTGTYGICAVCETEVETSDLLANPMARYCLCEMSPERQRALERDLTLAWQVQAALLPPMGLEAAGWRTHYRYLPHGAVSGDYCDLIAGGNGSGDGLYFMVGDVSGKGVAASLLMSHLNASLRALARNGLAPCDVIAQANRLLRESSLPSQYATLVCGRARASGDVEIVNAGHCTPAVVRAGGRVESLTTTGLPLGLTVDAAEPYSVETVRLFPGDALFLYTDGLTEAVNTRDEEYGVDRVHAVLRRYASESPRGLITRCLTDLSAFLGAAERSDDLTLLAMEYSNHS